MKTIKKCSGLLVVCLLLQSLLACNKARREEDQGPLELTFRITWPEDGGRGRTINEVVEKFNQEHEDIQVTMIGGNEKSEEIITTLNGQTTPEIFQMPYRLVRSLGNEGYWEDLGNSFSTELNNFYPLVVELGRENGLQYGIPWIGHSMAFVYNKDMTDAAGIDIAQIKTWEDFTGALKAVEAANPGVKGIGIAGAQNHDTNWMATMFIYAFGGQLVSNDGQTVAIDSPEAQAGLEYYFQVLGGHAQEGWQENNGGDVMEAFRDQRVAFEIQGPWGVTDIWKNGRPFNVAAFSPTQIENGYSEVGPYMLTIPTDLPAENQTAAEEFIRYLITTDSLNMIMKGEYHEATDAYYPFRVPIRSDMVDTGYFAEHPEFSAFIEGFKRPSIEMPVAAWQEVKEKYYLAGLNALATRQKTAAELTAELKKYGDPILQR